MLIACCVLFEGLWPSYIRQNSFILYVMVGEAKCQCLSRKYWYLGRFQRAREKERARPKVGTELNHSTFNLNVFIFRWATNVYVCSPSSERITVRTHCRRRRSSDSDWCTKAQTTATDGRQRGDDAEELTVSRPIFVISGLPHTSMHRYTGCVYYMYHTSLELHDLRRSTYMMYMVWLVWDCAP